jgi:hypothetical protein
MSPGAKLSCNACNSTKRPFYELYAHGCAFAENAISLQKKNLKQPYKKETRRGITNLQ